MAEAHDRSSGVDQAGLAAEHYLAAGDEVAALPRLLTAGENDLHRPAPDAAVRHFERAATLSRQFGRDAERLRALLGLGAACLGAQRIDAAADAYETARGEAMVMLDQSAQIRALAGLMQVAFALDQIPEALGLIRQALTLPVAPGDEMAERALVQATSRIVPIYGILRPLWAEGREHVGRMLQVRIAQLTHPDYVLDRLMALVAEADVALVAGSLDHARRSADAAIRLANTLGAERELAHAHRLRALVAHREGEHPAAEVNLEESRDIATQVGEPTLGWRVLIAEVELRRGPSDERALLAAEEAIRANLPASFQETFGAGSITLH